MLKFVNATKERTIDGGDERDWLVGLLSCPALALHSTRLGKGQQGYSDKEEERKEEREGDR